MWSCLKLDMLKSKHTQGDMVSKIKFYMDYFVSKLRRIYFSTFSGNRFNCDYIGIAILQRAVAGCFKKPSWARRSQLGHLRKCLVALLLLSVTAHIPALHSSQPLPPTGECQKQTNKESPATSGTTSSCSLIPLLWGHRKTCRLLLAAKCCKMWVEACCTLDPKPHLIALHNSSINWPCGWHHTCLFFQALPKCPDS